MDVLLIFLLIGLWIVLTGFIVDKGPKWLVRAGAPRSESWATRVLLLVAMLAIPLGDDLWGRFRVNQLCSAEGGQKIFKTIQNVEGVQVNGINGDLVGELGYRFIETRESSFFKGRFIKEPARYSVGPNGLPEIEKNIVPKARYAHIQGQVQLPGQIRRYQQFIIDLKTNDVLAKDTSFVFLGGWAFRMLYSAYGGASGGCSRALTLQWRFLHSVVQPPQ
jgi:hypothetical protein